MWRKQMRKKALALTLAACLAFAGLFVTGNGVKAAAAVVINLTGIANGSGDGYVVTDECVTIYANGDYIVKGTSTTRYLQIGYGGTFNITLDGVSISSTNASPLVLGKDANVMLLLKGANVLDASFLIDQNFQMGLLGWSKTLTIANAPGEEGSLTSIGKWYGMGIYNEGAIIINSGTINAIGGLASDGICGRNVTINGGTVNAKGGVGFADDNGFHGGGHGIRGEELVTINGGTITAIGGNGAEHSMGGNGIMCLVNSLIINDGTINATGGTGSSGIGDWNSKVIIEGGMIHATGGAATSHLRGGSGINCGFRDAVTGDSPEILIKGGLVNAIGGASSATNPGGVGIGGTACDLVISGGTVNATGGAGGGAGIGTSAYGDGGSHTITGGVVVARGTGGAAGIGSSFGGNATGNINISGGTVAAIGSNSADGKGGAGIGGSAKTNTWMAYDINLSGGTVYAAGGTGADGIGIGADAHPEFAPGMSIGNDAIVIATSITDEAQCAEQSISGAFIANGVTINSLTARKPKFNLASDGLPIGTALMVPDSIELSGNYYTVTLSPGPNAAGVPAKLMVKEGALDMLGVPVPIRPGYVFSHWSRTENGGAWDASPRIDGNGVTIYAVWDPHTVTTPTPAPLPTVADAAGNKLAPDKDGIILVPETDAIIQTERDTTINLPSGIIAKQSDAIDAPYIVTAGKNGARITYPSGITLALGEGKMLVIDDESPLGVVPLLDTPFDDVTAGAWYEKSVAFVTAHALFTHAEGNTFSPGTLMTRGMLVTALHRAAGMPAAEGSIYNDVPVDAYYAGATAWAKEAGVASGTGNGYFSPDGSITREQLVTMLMRFANTMGMDTTLPPAAGNFADNAKISVYAQDAVRWATANGIIFGGTDGNFNPKGVATRAETAAILQRFIGIAQ